MTWNKNADTTGAKVVRQISQAMNPIFYKKRLRSEKTLFIKTINTSDIHDVRALSPHRTTLVIDGYNRYIVKVSFRRVIAILNGQEEWQNIDYTFTEVERVYETRYDCSIGRREAA